MKQPLPLVIDLDGSLLRTDSLHESLAAALHRPRVLAGALWQLVKNDRAALKHHLATGTQVDVNLLPANTEVLAFVRSEHETGRAVYLATGADSSLADDVLERFPHFDGSFASDGQTNLTGQHKAERLVHEFGARGFDYVGDSAKDRAVWRQAARSYLVTTRSPNRRLPRWARNIEFDGVLRENARPLWRTWAKELRIHQSLKNLLLFLPLLAAHAFSDAEAILLVLAGFISFTLMASSVYLLNDLLDLHSDRLHARKASRPLAAGRILPMHALLASAVLAIVSVAAAIVIDIGFTVVLILYAMLTCLYSFWLKRVTLVDVTVLAMLYMIRILAGAIIAGIELSFWFTGVTLFLFVSLALVKRYAELARHASSRVNHHVPGRGYCGLDATVVLPLGVGTGMAALLLMAIYIQSDAVTVLYPSGGILWLVIPSMFYWIGNIWLQAGRGAVHDDPIIFALKNPASLISATIIALLFLAASTPLQAVVEQMSLSVG